MTEEIESLARQLVQAVEITMNACTTQAQRAEAYALCETFKETSPLCAQCGLFLCKRENPSIIRHFGYQLMEHCIKFRWNMMSPEEKLYIKNNTMELLSMGTLSILEEEIYIKDALSRIVVEMIKREWPQQWSTLLKELFSLCRMGETQKELVLLIFLRLAEDVFVLQNIPSQRRREIYVGLTQNINDIWAFFLSTLVEHNTAYSQNQAPNMIHYRIVKTLLETLCGGFLEWIPSSHFMTDNCILLQMLCQFLIDEQLQLLAAECLLIIVSRKGKTEERKPVLLLFSSDAMAAINQAASVAASLLSTKEYNFLKRLCLVLAGLGSQLAGLLSCQEEIPNTFKTFLDTILAFTKHSSQLLTSIIIPTWSSFLGHPIISRNAAVIAVMPSLLEISVEKFVKVGFPTRTDSPSCFFSRLDFDNDDDFTFFFFGRFRVDLADMVRHITTFDPVLAFSYSSKWLDNQLLQPVITGNDGLMCDLHSPSAVQWEALAVFLECTQLKLQKSSKPKPSLEDGIRLLKKLLEFKTEDPILLSSVLSCISALFHFASLDQQYFIIVLEKIFESVVFGASRRDNSALGKLTKNVRRHACSSLIKIARSNPTQLVPMFDHIYSHIKRLGDDLAQVSQFEKCMLYEFLVIISNAFHDYERQLAFLKEIMEPITNMWMCPDFLKSLESVENFAANVGLLQPAMSEDNDPFLMYRIQVIYRLSFVVGILKRSKWPDDPAVARKGVFVLNEDNGIITFRNPLMPCISPLLKGIFQLIRALNLLWLPETRRNFHPDFAEALSVQESERQCILGPGSLPPANLINPSCEKMQRFIARCYEYCFNIVGTAGPVLGAEFYSIPQLSNIVFNSVFSGLEHVSDFKLKMIIRTFFKPYVQHCPQIYEDSVLIPVLSELCPFMFLKLNSRWEAFSQRYGTSTGSEEMTESQEICEDQLNRLLTKEYLDLIGVLLFSKVSTNSVVEEMEEDTDKPVNPSAVNDQLSSRGIKLLSSEKICSAMVMTLFSALYWLDTSVSVKATNMCLPVLKQMLLDNLLTKDEQAHFILQSILYGLAQLGEHDINCSLLIALGTHAYELLRTKFSSILNIFKEISDSPGQAIQEFDEKLDPNSSRKCGDKVKRTIFRKIVQPVIGQNIGQKHKRKMEILNLRPIVRSFEHSNNTTAEEEYVLSDLFK